MSKEQKQLIVILAIAVLLLVSIGRHFFSKNKAVVTGNLPAAGSVVDKITDNTAFLASVRENIRIFREQEAKWDREWGNDPFSGGGNTPYLQETGNAGLVLSGIVWDEKTPLAMVNNQVVKKGDHVGNFKVIQIKKSSVVLSAGEEELELQLFQ